MTQRYSAGSLVSDTIGCPCGVRKFDRAANRSVSRAAEFVQPTGCRAVDATPSGPWLRVPRPHGSWHEHLLDHEHVVWPGCDEAVGAAVVHDHLLQLPDRALAFGDDAGDDGVQRRVQ